MNWRFYLRATATSLFSWRLIVKELVGIGMPWIAYLMASMLVQDPALKSAAPDWLVAFVPLLFWPTVNISGISLIAACVKSVLPAACAWVLIAPLYLLGFAFAAKIALFIANVAVVLYAIGFAFHGGRLRVASHS